MIDVASLRSGKKQMFLRQHRDTVLDCVEIFGEGRVKELFCLRAHSRGCDTLERLKNSKPDGRNMKYTLSEKKLDYLELRIEGIVSQVRENKKTIDELKTLFNQFVESTSNQVAKALLIPLLRNVLSFEGELPELTSDELDITTLLQQSARLRGSRDAKRKRIGGFCRITHE